METYYERRMRRLKNIGRYITGILYGGAICNFLNGDAQAGVVGTATVGLIHYAIARQGLVVVLADLAREFTKAVVSELRVPVNGRNSMLMGRDTNLNDRL